MSGQAEGVAELPDGRFQPPMGMTCAETQLRTRVKAKLGRTVTIGRVANLTKPINGRAACHYCGPCERGCQTHSYFNSAFTTVADALATGKMTHVANAMVYKVLTDPDTNRANGLLYIDRVTREPREIRGRVVVLCAQAQESARILLNSANRQNASGLGNSSGVLGHYLMDHLSGRGRRLRHLRGVARPGHRRTAPSPERHLRHPLSATRRGSRSTKFLRGYGFQGGGGAQFNWSAPGFGESFKAAVKKPVQGDLARGLSASAWRASRTTWRSTRAASSTPTASPCSRSTCPGATTRRP